MTDRLLLLDTNILSLMGLRRPPPGLRSWLLTVGIGRLAVCFPVVTELLRGAFLLQERDPERAALIRDWVGQILAKGFVIPQMCPQVAEIYARMTSVPSLRPMWTTQRNEKRNRMGHDLMIASVAIVYEAPIITVNVRDYLAINSRFRLPGVYHPLEERWHVRPPYKISLPGIDAEQATLPARSLPRIHEEEYHVSV